MLTLADTVVVIAVSSKRQLFIKSAVPPCDVCYRGLNNATDVTNSVYKRRKSSVQSTTLKSRIAKHHLSSTPPSNTQRDLLDLFPSPLFQMPRIDRNVFVNKIQTDVFA